MKKAIIVLVIIMVVCFVIAGILALIEINNMKLFTYDINQSETSELTETINSIEINSTKINDINIISTDDISVTATLNGTYKSITNKTVALNVKSISNNLEISVDNEGFLKWIELGDFNNTLELNIYIPKTYSKDLNLNIVCGDLNIDGISSNLYIDGVTSNINITYSKFDNAITINSVASKINLNLPKGSDYFVVQSKLLGNMTYSIDGTTTNSTLHNGKNKIEINGVISNFTINEYSK